MKTGINGILRFMDFRNNGPLRQHANSAVIAIGYYDEVDYSTKHDTIFSILKAEQFHAVGAQYGFNR